MQQVKQKSNEKGFSSQIKNMFQQLSEENIDQVGSFYNQIEGNNKLFSQTIDNFETESNSKMPESQHLSPLDPL